MYSTNFRNKFNLLGQKIVLLGAAMLLAVGAMAQANQEVFNPRYDERKIVTYGFSLAAHSASFKLKYSDYFATPAMDSVHSIMPRKRPGFKLGFIVNFKLAQFLDARITPTVAFSEYVLEYNYTANNQPQLNELVESTGVEFPVLLKYKSQRRNNIRMYVVGGATPVIEAAGRSNLEEDQNRLQLDRVNVNLEIGLGLDMYYPLFKFSPEVRFAYGMVNLLTDNINEKNIGLSDLRTKTLTFYFHFQ
jgi:hypothetical protein